MEIAACSVPPPSRMSALEFWDRFHNRVEACVQQFNDTAGKALWVSRSFGPFVHQINVESESRATHRIECSFDLDRGMLRCRPGPGLKIKPFQFQWTGGSADLLKQDGKEFTLANAVKVVLNRLVQASSGKAAPVGEAIIAPAPAARAAHAGRFWL
jgi:hypothetical protein